MKHASTLLALLLCAVFRTACAIPVIDLPSQLQDCVAGNDCYVNTSTPAASFPGMNAYQFIDNLMTSPRTGYAVQYSLLPPSGVDSTASGFTPYSGSVWLTVYDSYDLTSGAARVTVYTDTVSPTPQNLLYGDSNGLDVGIDLDGAALTSASGYRLVGLDYNLNSIDQGTMRLLGDQGVDALSPCLAEDCYSRARLNLLYLSFTDIGNGSAMLAFNPADTRALLYQLQLYDPYGYDPNTMDTTGTLTRQSYYIATVPLPGTYGLLLSGLGLLGLRLRRVKA